MKQLLVILFIFSILVTGKSQDTEEKKDFGIKFSGFVKNDFILDSRQTVSVREGHFLLYPANESLDKEGEDINDRASFNYLSIQSRLKGTLTGPDAFGAKTSGVLEGAFFGHTNSDINGFRLRHAFFKLNWASTELLLGQYWHMMFVTGCFPGTVSFNTGVPFQFFSRNPQIRITQTLGNLKIAGAVGTQRDFASPGGPDPLRNALLPDLQGQISYSSGKLLYAGIGAGYKQLVPRIVTDSLYKTKEAVGGISAQAFAKITTDPVTIKFQGTYAQDGYDGLFIGGYAIKSVTDSVRNDVEYTTLNTLSFWTDIHTNNNKLQFGLFAGYSKNLGSINEIEDLSTINASARGSNIAAVYRISPRVILNSGKVRFALELEHTGAAYGSSVNSKGIPQKTNIVVNNRILVAVYYFF